MTVGGKWFPSRFGMEPGPRQCSIGWLDWRRDGWLDWWLDWPRMRRDRTQRLRRSGHEIAAIRHANWCLAVSSHTLTFSLSPVPLRTAFRRGSALASAL